MVLNGFVSGSSDEELLKSLPTENSSEELVKAMNKAGLVQKDVQVTGKNGQVFTRKQWVKASDLKATDKAPAKQSTSEPDDANKESTKKVDASTLAGKSYKEVVQILDDAPVGTTITGLIDPDAQKRFGHNDDIRITKHSGYVANYASGTKDKETWWEFNGAKHSDAAGDIVSTLKGTNKYYKARSKSSDEGKPSTLTSTEVKDSSGAVIGTIDAVTLKNGKTVFQAKGTNGRSDTYAFTEGGKKEAERFLKGSAKTNGAVKFDKTKSDKVEKSETEKKGTTDKAAFEKIQSMKGYESQTGLVHGDYVYAEHNDDGDYNFTKMKRVDFEAGNSDEGTEMTPQQVLEDIKKPNIDHNTGVSKPEKKEMLQDYFSGNHGHANGKAALSALLGKGYSREDIISEASKQGVTWKKNDHEGINWMRASMAIQKHLGGGSSKTGGH